MNGNLHPTGIAQEVYQLGLVEMSARAQLIVEHRNQNTAVESLKAGGHVVQFRPEEQLSCQRSTLGEDATRRRRVGHRAYVDITATKGAFVNLGQNTKDD